MSASATVAHLKAVTPASMRSWTIHGDRWVFTCGISRSTPPAASAVRVEVVPDSVLGDYESRVSPLAR
jgi:hypothetical protein